MFIDGSKSYFHIKPMAVKDNPFLVKNPKEVMRELLKNSKPLSHDEAMRKMKEAAEAQKKNK